MAVITKLLSSMAKMAVVCRPALPISNFPRLYTPTSLQLSTHAFKDVTHQSLPTIKSQNHNILGLSEDKEPVADIDEWKLTERTILQEIQPMARFVRRILNSNRYTDGELLSLEDEIEIVEKLLPYHPRFEDKKGCGIDSIMVGRHPEYGESRCLFIIQKNGRYTDISYRKCLKGLIWKKYPSSAEKFISIHFK